MIGVVVFSAILVGCASLLVLRAHAHGVLAAVLAGLALRLVVMAVVHVAAGGDGLLYKDDAGFLRAGEALADEWRAGRLVDPAAYDVRGQLPVRLSAADQPGVRAHRAERARGQADERRARATLVLVTALLAGRLLGERAQRIAAWIAAVAPTLVWWCAPMVKEALAATLFAACLLLLVRAWSVPRAVGLVALLLALATVRSGAAVVVLVAALAGYGVAAYRTRRELSPSPRRAARRLRRRRGGRRPPGAVARRPGTTAGRLLGCRRLDGVAVPGLRAAHDPGGLRALAGRAVSVGVRRARPGVGDQALYPGMWVLYALYPIAAWGAWRHRHRPEALMLVAAAGLFILLNSATSGFVVRQRSTVEAVVVVLAVASGASPRLALRLAAAAFGVAALAAAAQSRAVIAPAAILAGALVTLLASRWAPPRGFEVDFAATPLADNLRRALGRRSTAGGVPGELEPS